MERNSYIVFSLVVILMIVGCEKSSKGYNDIVEFQEKVEQKKKQVLEAEKEYTQLLKQWNKKVPDSERVDISKEMSKRPSERIETWLKRRVQQEKPISYEGLADEIDSLNDVIGKLQNKINSLEQQTGFTEPYLVRKGDTHFGMAMEFLMNKHNMSKQQAIKYIKPLGLYDKLKEGFFVYFFFDKQNNRLHTSVNKGKANISPYRYKRRYEKKQKEKLRKLAKKYKKEQKNYQNAIRKVKKMRQNIRDKSQKLAELDSMYNDILVDLGSQSKRVDSLDRISNSVFYTIRSQKNLIEKGFYDIGFLGLSKKLKNSVFDSLNFPHSFDLRRKTRFKIPKNFAEKNLTIYNEYGDKVNKYIEKSDGEFYLNLEDPVKNSRILVVYR